MVELLNNTWFLLLAAFAIAAITAVIIRIAVAWERVRRAEQEAVLKQDMLQRGFQAEDIERVLHATSVPPPASPASTVELSFGAKSLADEQAVEQLAAYLSACSASTIEEVLAAVRGADLSTQRAILKAVEAMNDNSWTGVSDETLLAVVRALCDPAGKAAAESVVSEGVAAR
jgi:hypothetical protein